MASADSKVSHSAACICNRATQFVSVCERANHNCNPLTMSPLCSWWHLLNPIYWLLGRQFINDKAPYDASWVFPKLKKTNTKCWSVFSAMTIASVGFLSKMFIGKQVTLQQHAWKMHMPRVTPLQEFRV